MDTRPSPALAESIAAAQAWWREAGVDHTYRDEPQAWLAAEAPEATVAKLEKPVEQPKPRLGGDPTNWPQDLAGFRQWWLEEPSLGPAPRITPRGEAGAPVMMLVPMPEAEDRDTLLAGPQGRLLASIATAMGIAPEAVYLASALPSHMPEPDWQGLADDGLGEIVLHHIALAAPQRLIVLGTRILPLLGHAPAQAAPAVSELAIQSGHMPLLTSYAPERLLGNARQRAGLWQCWLDWTGEGL